MLSAFDVSVFCPSPTEGAPRAVILGMLASPPVPVDRRRGRLGHDRPGDRRHRLARRTPARRCERCSNATSTIPERVEREGGAARAYAERTYAAPVVAEPIEGLLNDLIASRPARA